MANFTIEMMKSMEKFQLKDFPGVQIKVRVGIHSGEYPKRIQTKKAHFAPNTRTIISGGSRISQMGRGTPTPEFEAITYHLARSLPKTTWKWKILDRERGAFVVPVTYIRQWKLKCPVRHDNFYLRTVPLFTMFYFGCTFSCWAKFITFGQRYHFRSGNYTLFNLFTGSCSAGVIGHKSLRFSSLYSVKRWRWPQGCPAIVMVKQILIVFEQLVIFNINTDFKHFLREKFIFRKKSMLIINNNKKKTSRKLVFISVSSTKNPD